MKKKAGSYSASFAFSAAFDVCHWNSEMLSLSETVNQDGLETTPVAAAL